MNRTTDGAVSRSRDLAIRKLSIIAFVVVMATISLAAQDQCDDPVGAGNARGCGIGKAAASTVHLWAKIKQAHDQKEAERQAQAQKIYAGGHWPLDATAVCKDGWIAFSHHPEKTCSHHGGTATTAPAYNSPNESRASATHTYQPDYMADGYSPHRTVERDSHGRIKRSESAKDSFKHDHPCPSTGSTSGSCPGYVIDHVNPLECGGADAPFNMQWQTVADAKAKDKTERYCRVQPVVQTSAR